MGFTKAILSLAMLAVIVTFSYWLYASLVSAPEAPYWAEINGKMPDALRRFSCDQVRKRTPASPIASCKG